MLSTAAERRAPDPSAQASHDLRRRSPISSAPQGHVGHLRHDPVAPPAAMRALPTSSEVVGRAARPSPRGSGRRRTSSPSQASSVARGRSGRRRSRRSRTRKAASPSPSASCEQTPLSRSQVAARRRCVGRHELGATASRSRVSTTNRAPGNTCAARRRTPSTSSVAPPDLLERRCTRVSAPGAAPCPAPSRRASAQVTPGRRSVHAVARTWSASGRRRLARWRWLGDGWHAADRGPVEAGRRAIGAWRFSPRTRSARDRVEDALRAAWSRTGRRSDHGSRGRDRSSRSRARRRRSSVGLRMAVGRAATRPRPRGRGGVRRLRTTRHRPHEASVVAVIDSTRRDAELRTRCRRATRRLVP